MRPIIAHIQIESKIPPILIIQATPLKKKPLDGLHLRLLLRCNMNIINYYNNFKYYNYKSLNIFLLNIIIY